MKKALRYTIMPVVLFLSTIGNVYAGSFELVETVAFNSPQSGIYSFFKAIYYLVMFALILAAAFYATKFLARKGLGKTSSKTMKLVESMPLGADKSLHLVKVGNQYFLIGSASKSMFMMSEIQQDKLFEEQDSTSGMNGYEYVAYEDSIEIKDLGSYLGSVKNNLNKLKSMVRGNNNNEI